MKKWLAIGLSFATGVVLAASQPADSPLDNRQVLQQLREHPELFADLLNKQQQFDALSARERERLRNLSRAIAEESSASQYRLERAAERYADWYGQLTDKQRELIEAAPNQAGKLERIRALRQVEWVIAQPRARREKFRGLKFEDRKALVAGFRSEDLRRRKEWEQAVRHWDELCRDATRTRLADFEQPVQDFVQQQLLPRLTRDERDRLRAAEGLWPGYPATLVALADHNTFKLLMPESGKSRMEELPASLQKQLLKTRELNKRRLATLTGKWPEFALAVSETAERFNLSHDPLGPCRPGEFAPTIADFIQTRLLSESSPLQPEERARLTAAEANWPRYPRVLAEIIDRHALSVPGVTLPGPPEYWDSYRDKPRLPEPSIVPDQTLRYFALLELTPAESAELRISLTDPAGRARLQQEYARRHPREWRTLEQNDALKRQRQHLEP